MVSAVLAESVLKLSANEMQLGLFRFLFITLSLLLVAESAPRHARATCGYDVLSAETC